MKQNLSYRKCEGVVPEEKTWNEVKRSYGRRGSEVKLSLGKQLRECDCNGVTNFDISRTCGPIGL